MTWPSPRTAAAFLRDLAGAVAFAWSRRPDLIHCNEHNVHPFGVALARVLRRPILTHVRFHVEEGFVRWAFVPRYRRPDAILFTSERQRSDTADAFRDPRLEKTPRLLVPNGVETSRFGSRVDEGSRLRTELGIPEDALVIGTASDFKPIKRIPDLVRVMAEVCRSRDDVVGLIAGHATEGHEEELAKIHAALDEANMGSRIRLIGYLVDVEPFFQAVDVFLSASEYETFGCSVCEAMACRSAVVAYEGGSVAEVVGPIGRIVPTGDVEGLSRETLRLLGDAEELDRLKQDGRRRVEQTWDASRSFESLRSAYGAVLGPDR